MASTTSTPSKSPYSGNVDVTDMKAKYLGRIEVSLDPEQERSRVQNFLHEGHHKDFRFGVSKDLLITINGFQGVLNARPKGGGVSITIPTANIYSMISTSQKIAVVVTNDDQSGTAYCFKLTNRKDMHPFMEAIEQATARIASRFEIASRRGRSVSYTSLGNSENGRTITTATTPSKKIPFLERQVADLREKLNESEQQRLEAEKARLEAEHASALAQLEMETVRREVASVAAEIAADFAEARHRLGEQYHERMVHELSLVHAALQEISETVNNKKSTGSFWQQVEKRLMDPDDVLDRLRETEIKMNLPEDGKALSHASSKYDNSGQLALSHGASQRLLTLIKRASSNRASLPNSKRNSTVPKFTTGEIETLDGPSLRRHTLTMQQQMDALERELALIHQQCETLHKTNQALTSSLETTEQRLKNREEEFENEKQILADTIAAFTSKSVGNSDGDLLSKATFLDSLASLNSTAVDESSHSLLRENQQESTVILEKGEGGLGFSIAGGRDQPLSDDDDLLYITDILPGGAAAESGQLQVGDAIISVNGTSLIHATHLDAVTALQKADKTVTIVIHREILPTSLGVPSIMEDAQPTLNHAQPTLNGDVFDHDDDEDEDDELDNGASMRQEEQLISISIQLRGPNDGLGFSIAGGADHPIEDGDDHVYVTTIIEDGAAAREGRLQPFDRLVKVNGIELEGLGHEAVVKLLQQNSDGVELVIGRVTGRSFSFAEADAEETFEIAFTKNSDEGLGFSIAGGTDCPVDVGDSGIYVTHILPSSPAARDGRLLVGDRIIEVNGVDVYEVTHQQAVEALKSAQDEIFLLVQRFPLEDELEIDIQVNDDERLGISLSVGEGEDDGLYVVALLNDGAAAKGGLIRPGDRIIEVNGTRVDGLTQSQVNDMLRHACPHVKLVVGRLTEEESFVEKPDNTEENVLNGHDQIDENHQNGQNLSTNDDIILTVELIREGSESLGFSIAGGTDDSVEEGDTGIYISEISPDGLADRTSQLQIGDRIISVNGHSLSNISHAQAVNVLRGVEEKAVLVIARDPTLANNQLIHVTLNRKNGGFGFSITGGTDDPIEAGDDAIYISHIVEDSAAADSGEIEEGDQIVKINDSPLMNVTHQEAVTMLTSSGNELHLVLSRFSEPEQHYQGHTTEQALQMVRASNSDLHASS